MNWLNILILLSIIIIIIHFLKLFNIKQYYEGFNQDKPFILKQNNQIYDSFYAMIYDDLYKSENRSDYEYKQIIEMTQPSEKSMFLDVGSGTGHLVNNLTNAGFNAIGIDKSKSMIDYSKTKFPGIETTCRDVIDSMNYDKGTFTHITCMNFTIYHLEDKLTFFKNCYYWLMPNGYLILHLVNRNKYNPIVPAANPPLLDNPQKYSNTRIKNSKINFIDFEYKNSHDFKNDKNNRVIIRETFTDASTKNIRQNELTLYMENIDEIVNIAKKCGFIPHAQIKMVNDEYQYIYIFERLL
jgi:SAM-dependent methyltransferase